jgi:hypothetical protein
MNRRQFIKASIPVVAIPAIAITCKYEDDEKGPEKESKNRDWRYIAYCYERKQGEWTFSYNARGSFAPEREYMTFEEEDDIFCSDCAGWMESGKLHFQTLDDACDFVEMHVRVKDDINLLDSIYDVYRVKRGFDIVDDANNIVGKERDTEIHVAHYWFNGDTGGQIQWVDKKDVHTNWSLVEFS